MDQFPDFAFSAADVKNAGKVLAGDLTWTDETAPTIRHAFSIANSFRDSHAFPMRSIRFSVIQYARHAGIHGISAARLKRMKAIRGKLARGPAPLHKLQDLGGVRLILPSIDGVNSLIGTLRERMPHHLRRETDYIASPKASGYRSHHLMYDYTGRKGRIGYDKRRIEVQIRTQLQHSWATTVEAVGLFRGEQLKNHLGSEEWLRFFVLMSGDFADFEGCPVGAGIPAKAERQDEIRRLAEQLDTLTILDSVAHGFRGADIPITADYRPTHYLIKYDHATRTVHVEPYRRSRSATLGYDHAEFADNRSGQDTENVVLVEVDKIDNLKAAYPNYFGDVGLFRSHLRQVIQGKAATDYAAAERDARRPDTRKPIDLSWLHGSRFGRPGYSKGKQRDNAG